MLKRLRLSILALVTLGFFFQSPSARAWPYYFEFGGSMATFSNPASLLTSQGLPTSSSAGSGYSMPLTLGLQLQEFQNLLLFAVALQTRYIAGTSGAGDSFTVLPVSPVFRIEIWRLVLGAGYTNLVYNGFGFKKNSAINSVLTLEAQFLFPITPEIDFGLQGSRETFTASSGSSSVMEYGAFFRLNFGMSKEAKTQRRKFKGWRYPLGAPMN